MYTDLIKATYCQSYGLTPEAIDSERKNIPGGRKRQLETPHGLIHVDFMRMCLAHYFVYSLCLPTKLGGTKAGYVSHSTVIHNKDIMNHYIHSKDPYLYPYWERLMEVVKLYENETGLSPLLEVGML